MKDSSSKPAKLMAKGAFLLATLVLMLGCDPGGGLPGAPSALRSGSIPVVADQVLGVCTSTRTIEPTDGVPAPVLENTGEWVLYPELSDEFDGVA
ncbi:MAG: hypothetical protein HKO71_08725, partial [Pseudomonadales bacterium]|nr:hypothetical protein [Gammaproteobacteria bacterium]NNL57824.1 hypothetical protein [Pseudomonadales bacterium]